MPEISNWGGEKILKESLQNVPSKDFHLVYEKLSTPSGLSFYQKEELDLLMVKRGHKTLNNHVKKYFWINNSYLDATILDENFFKKRLNDVRRNEVEEKIKKIKNYLSNSKNEKRVLIRKYSLPKETQKISERLSYSIYWQDERKENIFIANHYIKLFLKEISRRYDIPFQYLEKIWCWEIEYLLKSKKFNKEKMVKRINKQAGFMDSERERNIAMNEIEFNLKIKPILEMKVSKKIKEIKGISVNIGKGKVRGKVRILLDPRNSHKMQKGEILLAPMTSPEYILAMRKASAIVTDTGGMTCHAAIVSRELGIPCIVGTKIATKVFKNGMEVEIDAKNGIIKMLN